MKQLFIKIFSIDRRALAAFRVMLGLVVMAEFVLRLPTLEAFYTSRGIFPRGFYLDQLVNPWTPSIFFLSDALPVQLLLMLIGILLGFLLVVGWRTRWVTVACWIFFASFVARNFWAFNGSGQATKMFLFWGMFLPLGSRFSMDAAAADAEDDSPVFSAATVALMLQVIMIYLFTSILKVHPIWYEEGSALYYALNLDGYTTDFGRTLLTLPPSVLQVMTFSIFVFEWIAPLLALIPLWPLRLLVVYGFVFFHTAIDASMEIEFFPLVSVVGWLVFLPAQTWPLIRADAWFEAGKRFFRRLHSRLPTHWRGKDYGGTWYRRKCHTVVIVFCLFLVTWWNTSTVTDQVRMTRPFFSIFRLLHLRQTWNMFAPSPHSQDGWITSVAKLNDGSEVDVYNGDIPVSFNKNGKLKFTILDIGWSSFRTVYWHNHQDEKINRQLAIYFCRKWNRRHPNSPRKKMQSISFYATQEPTPPPGVYYAPVAKENYFNFSCNDFKDEKLGTKLRGEK